MNERDFNFDYFQQRLEQNRVDWQLVDLRRAVASGGFSSEARMALYIALAEREGHSTDALWAEVVARRLGIYQEAEE